MKERLIDLIKKMISLKFICGIILPTILLIFGFLDASIWLASILAVLGARELSKKFPNQFEGN